MKDMESEDYGFYKGLEFLAENSVRQYLSVSRERINY